MATRDWLPALALGTLVAAGGMLWQATHPPVAPYVEPTTETAVPDRWVFLSGPALEAGGAADVLVIRGANTTAAHALSAGIVEWCPPTAVATWLTPSVGMARVDRTTHDCGAARHCPVDHLDTCPDVEAPDHAVAPGMYRQESGPLRGNATFGSDGHWAARITYFVFLESGRLLATNAPTWQEARFDLSRDFVRFEPGVLWLGDGAAPTGTRLLPDAVRGYAPIVRENLTGLPVGAIVTRELVEHPGKDLFGTVYLTVRIEELLEPNP